MGQLHSRSGPGGRNRIFSAVENCRRRQILMLLGDRVSPVDEEELAIHLAATEQDKSLLEVTDEEVIPIQVDLVHAQLPVLEAASLVDWDRQEGTVSTRDHPVLNDPKFQRILETEAEGWDDVLANLANDRRRIILSVLKDRDAPMARADLAIEIHAHETGGRSDLDYDAVQDCCATLHHVDLPKLQQAGLVAYDIETGTARYIGHEAFDDEWVDSRTGETPRAILPDATQGDDIWAIDGRDNVIACGQSLFEQAADELFLMFTTDGLLEAGCIRRLQDAVDRGVDVYLGSQTPSVRDLVRERIPGAVIWEPQMDWLNLPPEYERVGRLVFADRNAIMLATLGEETESGVYAETAITGFGENNPLVILLREMLGSRLDHLDAQSEDFLTEVPL